MRIARFAAGDEVGYGVVGEARGDGPPGTRRGRRPSRSSPSWAATRSARDPTPSGSPAPAYRLDEIRLLAPVLPSKVIAVGKNYADHAREMGGEPPAEPVLFLKPSTAVCGPGDPIRYPVHAGQTRSTTRASSPSSSGRLCREVPASQAADVIFGYTCANDVTARDLQERDGQWARAKGFDTFCPLGPWIETDADPADLELVTSVNGEVRQRARTSQLLHDVAELVAYASSVMTLIPGDVLLTGTPAGVGPLENGDEVSVTIETIGTLTNPVANRD